MTDQFRAMCAELLQELCCFYKPWDLQEERYSDAMKRARALLAKPEPEEDDIHYAWELHDAECWWQAGGSADSLEDVQREGNHYLQTYSQDGPHKLIIYRHCVTTIEEVTND